MYDFLWVLKLYRYFIVARSHGLRNGFFLFVPIVLNIEYYLNPPVSTGVYYMRFIRESVVYE